jgi:protein N-terminal amidase
MDINPYKFEAPFDAFEFAEFQKAQGAQWLWLSMAWLESKNDSRPQALLEYWATRLIPLIQASSESRDPPIHVIICNRTGVEGGNYFVLFPIE